MDATINGIRMSWEEAGRRGRGPTLLLVHGFPLNRTMWRPQLSALTDIAHLVAPDLRGHGASEAPPGLLYVMDDFAADLRALLEHLGITRAIYCGLSLGGYIGFAFARNYPELLQGLVLADTQASADTDERRETRETLARSVEREGVAAVVDPTTAELTDHLAASTRIERPDVVGHLREMIAGMTATGMAGTSRGMAARPDSSDTLSHITVPTTIIVGAEDTRSPPEEAQRMHAAIPGSSLTIIDDAGHVSSMEQPEKFNTAIRVFLEGK